MSDSLRTSAHKDYGTETAAAEPKTQTLPVTTTRPMSLLSHPNVLLAVVNPLSGERAAAEAVANAFCATLGSARVYRLDPATFKNPELLGNVVRERSHAHEKQWEMCVNRGMKNSPSDASDPLFSPTGLRRKPTILVAGGDGTVAFVMNVIQDVFVTHGPAAATASPNSPQDLIMHREERGEEINAAMSTSHSPTSTKESSDLTAVLTLDKADSPGGAGDAADAVPAVAVFPMGTGNDLSHTLGFGLGFTRNKLCLACTCCPRDIDALLVSTVEAPMVRFDRWEAIVTRVMPYTEAGRDDDVLLRVGFNNYVSFGVDADISRRFDESRKAYPALHRVRTMNKLWYGVHGLASAPFAPRFHNGNVRINIDKVATPLPKSAHNCKAVVITNVTGYSGGVDLWKMRQPTTATLPRPATGGNTGTVPTKVALQPAAVGDGMLEVQTLGGLFHMTFLRSGIIGADRIGQGAEIDLVVSNPDGKPLGVRLQADGEPLGEFAAPFRIRVRPALRGPLYVHAAPNSDAATRSVMTGSVVY